MTPADVVRLRLAAQHLARPRLASPAALLAAMGPVQAQDYAAGSWALGLRLRGATAATVERALADGAIVRTHPLRNTLHFVAAADVRWLLALTAPRQRARLAARHAELGLDAAQQRRANRALGKALADGAHLDRAQVAAVLARAKVDPGGQRLPHLIMGAELDDVLCSGARRGKQLTFAALDHRLPATPPRPREEALADLATRYFTTRGPASLADFAWWSGLAPADCRAALASIERGLARHELGGAMLWSARGAAASAAERAHLLPGWDEYTVAYRDRTAIQAPRAAAVANRYGILAPVAILDGRVVGTWTRTLTAARRSAPATAAIRVALVAAVPRAGLRAIEAAAARYAAFLGVAPRLEVAR